MVQMVKKLKPVFADHIIIKVLRPKDYEDVHPDVMMDDFLMNPQAFRVELVENTLTVEDAEGRCPACFETGSTRVCQCWRLE